MASKRPVDYSALIRDANSFNKRLALDRSQRLPSFDQQTGTVHARCALWRLESDRVWSGGGSSGGRLYSYPARRWQRTARHDQSASGSRGPRSGPHREAQLDGGAKHYAAPSAHPDQHLKHHRLGCSAAAFAPTPPAASHQQQPPPPRADSTGSYSFADSDSRDQSSATSQSVDSPPQSRHSQLEEEERQLCMNLAGRLCVELTPPSPPRPRKENHAEGEPQPTAGEGCRLRNGRVKPVSSGAEGQPARLSKKKNVGHSLMMRQRNGTNTNGRKTTPNNMNSAQIKTKPPRRGRPPKVPPSSPGGQAPPKPYVCPICDQSYKTRPGLSYHFIHVHHTILPRDLPVRLNGVKSAGSGELPLKLVGKRKMATAPAASSSSSAWASSPAAGTDARDLDRQKLKTARKTRFGPEQSAAPTRMLRNSWRSESPRELNSSDTAEREALQDREQPGSSSNSSPDGRQAAGRQPGKPDELDNDLGTEEVVSEVCQRIADAASATICELTPDDDERQLARAPSRRRDGGATAAATSQPMGSPSQTAGSRRSVESELADDRADSKPESDGRSGGGAVASGVAPVDGEQVGASLPPAGSRKRRSLFCDFCLGTVDKNRRTRLPEELISCSSCGSSGHPSCLQFSENIRRSVQLYNWQCIDCKTCSTCNKADHEDQLLFCDDCDRSYHTYCLRPRLDALPEGNWTCELCLFTGGASPAPGAAGDLQVSAPLEMSV